MKDLKDSIVYQIYPASFQDSNNDGMGDIRGIIDRLDYLKSLGIDYLWLSPIYPSPMVDMGYDIQNYKSINPKMGTMEDFDELLEKAKAANIGIIMDLVLNHTSDKHPWFQEALKDKNSKYRDYYFFRKAKKGQKYPNNWTNSMGNPAWEEVPGESGTFYLHLFSKEQPDLNWHNPDLLKDMEEVMTFWLDKGVKGFRCDMINVVYKESLEDGKTKEPTLLGQEHYLGVEGNHKLLKRIQNEVIIPHHAFLIGETYNVTLPQAKQYLENKELDELFEFETVSLDKGIFSYKVKPVHFKDSLIKWQTGLSFNALYLENHDQKRSIGRFVSDKDPIDGAKLLLTLLLTLRGTPFIYQGEELGARNYKNPNPFNSTDMVAKGIIQMLKDRRVPRFIQKSAITAHLRDDARAPMAFDSSLSHGFTKEGFTPWQKYNDYSSTINVKDEEKDEFSVLNTFKRLVNIRNTYAPLIKGDFKTIETKKKNVFAYERSYGNRTLYIILNLANKKESADKVLKDVIYNSRLIFVNKTSIKEFSFSPYEARIYERMGDIV